MIKNKNKDNLPKYPVLATKCCTECKRERPIWKNKVLKGVKHLFCKPCWNKFDASIKKEKREKVREKKAKTATLIECKKLIQKLAKLCNEPICCTSGHQFTEQDIRSGNCQGGHWRAAGSHPSTALYILNIHPQSYVENCRKHGNEYEYSRFMDAKYGEETKEMIYRMSHISYKWSKIELSEFKQQCLFFLKKVEDGVDKTLIKKQFLDWQHSTDWYKFMLHKLNE